MHVKKHFKEEKFSTNGILNEDYFEEDYYRRMEYWKLSLKGRKISK